MTEVTILIPFHAERERNGMLARAIRSAEAQTVPCTILPARDVHGLGAAITRNHGLMLVETEWTAFLDSDDEFDPTHVEKLLACAKENDADYVYSWFRVKGGSDPFPQFFGKPWEDSQPHCTTVTILVKTVLARDIGFIDIPEDDWHFTLRCVARGLKIVHHPERTWTWHHHGRNSSGRPGQGDAK